MPSDADDSTGSESGEPQTVSTYDLTCTDCTFEATVEGDVLEAFDVADTHQETHGRTSTDHFVNFELR